ncbi:endonuclease/exonuclease/phosphatase family protein [Actinacidiphila sp. ITFR-21]|uniref:endonuclease/exonuclease/phosphatase family protein n=1 Tax=Actinacidiphila sp. ITFR-21 TaxID=3075199 RepID=UPI00288BD5D6|nr:endonuclease/exonuclease/phosphatase family protein [Streptomyces sp. ITFR-21]WNI19803.1 endonuclease/exonuclease/phosphatase family protein [Streptomyces sp. ITFR-21]
MPIGVAGAVVLAAAGLSVNAAMASPSADALIAEVYGGGGNSGATYTNDFVELANAGVASVDLSGYSVQYLPGAPTASSKWQATALTGSLAGGSRYLVQEAAGAGGTTPLPTPDATGVINMSGTTGTIALVAGSDPLTCLNAVDCLADARIKDLVGFGTAVVHEGSGAAAGASNTASVARNASLGDTDDNAADFTAGAPTPQNFGGGTATEPPTTPPTSPTTAPPTTPPPAPTARIHDIQGYTRVSPLNGKAISGATGVVTGVRAYGSSQGFWFQDPNPDNDPRTSEGLFVYTGSTAPTVAVGDSVSVDGTVSEYYPGGQDTGIQSTTELTKSKVTVLSGGNTLPAAVVLDKKSVPDRFVPSAGGGTIADLPLRPHDYALDFYASLEGMNVQIGDSRVVGATDAYGELWVTVKPDQNESKRGGTLYTGYDDPNSGRLMVQSLIPTATQAFPVANVGDTLRGTTAGPLDYNQYAGTYSLAARTIGTVKSGGIKPEVTGKASASQVTVATYNVENLAPGNPQSKFDALAQGLVKNLRSPDVVALEEIQDDNGATDDGTVAADQTLQKLTDTIVAAGGPRYSWREIDPVNDKDGGQPGGNIRQAFLFNPARVGFTDRPGGDSTTAVGVTGTGSKTALTSSPGRIAPSDPAWADSRKPLAGEFTFRGKTLFVIANHFISKGGDQAIDSRFQPPVRSSESQRIRQAIVEHDFVRQIEQADPHADVVVLGDLNDYQFSPAATSLTGDGSVLTDLVNTLPAKERYSYVYEGNSQVLDHILVSPALKHVDYDVVHINSEFAGQTSDHDPQVVRLKP